MGLTDEACFEAGEPGVLQLYHALAARTDFRARETVDVKILSRVPGHLGQKLRLNRRLQLILRRKAATVPHLVIFEAQAYFRKELFLQFFAIFYVALTENLAAHVAEKAFGVVVLATLIDFVQNAQERRRRKDEPLDFDALRDKRIFYEGHAVFLKHVQERRPEIPHGISNREHQACRIHILPDSSAQGNDRLYRVQCPGPFLLLSGHSLQVVLHRHVTNVRQNRNDGRIPFLFARLETDHGTVVIKVQRSNFSAIPGIVKILAPMFRLPGAIIKARIQIDGSTDGVHTKCMDRIHHGINHMERVRIVASREVRVPFATNLDRTQKLFLLDTSHQGNFRFRRIVQR